jgi:hypothetical protein
LAYGIQQMQGIAGFKGWRWIFIIEGIASCTIAIIALLVLVDFPDRGMGQTFKPKQGFPDANLEIPAAKPGLFSKRSFLTKDEVSIILARIARDRGDAVPEKLTWKRLVQNLRDWKIWEFGVLIACNVSQNSTNFMGDVRLTITEHVHLLILLLPPPNSQGIPRLLSREDIRSHTSSVLSSDHCKCYP